MSIPNSRSSFIQYCLRKLGHPVITIEITQDQLSDRVDEALYAFYDFHSEGTFETLFKYALTATDITNGYITMPDNIIGAVDIFDIGSAYNIYNMFNIRYQIALNDLYTLTNVSMVPYFMAMQHISQLEELLVGRQPLRYNRHLNQLWLDMNWNNVVEGQYLVVKAYAIVNPEIYTKAWGDRWLMRYGTCLIRQQWLQNLSKHKNIVLPGGIQFNVKDEKLECLEEKAQLEEELRNTWNLPTTDMIGDFSPLLLLGIFGFDFFINGGFYINKIIEYLFPM